MTTIKGRSLSRLEEYYKFRNTYRVYTGFYLFGQFSEPWTTHIMYDVLKNIIDRHPELYNQVFDREIVDKKGKKKVTSEIAPVDSFKLSDVLEIVNDKKLESLEETINYCNEIMFDKGFDFNLKNKPLWKIFLINSKNVLFYTEHMLFDGTSGANFFRELKYEFNKLTSSSNCESSSDDDAEYLNKLVYSTGADSRVPVVSTDLYTCKPSTAYMLYILYKELAPVFVTKYAKRIYSGISYYLGFKSGEFQEIDGYSVGSVFTFDNHIDEPVINRKNTKILSLSKEDVGKLLGKCREHGVKMTSVLATIGNIGICGSANGYDIGTGIPFNVRPFVDEEKLRDAGETIKAFELFGLFMSQVSVEFPSTYLKENFPDPEGIKSGVCAEKEQIAFWNVAKYFQHHLSTRMEESLALAGTLDYVDPEDFVKSSLSKKKSKSYEISNVGVLKNGETEKQKLVNLVFNQPNGTITGYFGCNVAGTDIGGTNFALTCAYGLEEDFNTYAEQFDAYLKWLLK
ncbi:hypothetical protein B5S33_g3697 [[Candida] boidinii]|nr:hypothetical protein B5S30_g2441 [[Candida] boidinii]OWB85040.1 hypothetical protein B5S33_g3697 [[Candida] boidinii]GMF99184.1 unnamed protein product [[Candida] boidinii]